MKAEAIAVTTEAIDQALLNNAAALRAATDANLPRMASEASRAIRVSRTLADAIEDETDAMIHLLLLS